MYYYTGNSPGHDANEIS